MGRLFSKALEEEERLISSRKNAFSKGWPTGFYCLDRIASFLKGYQTLLYAPPHVGKSVIMLDILMAQAEMGRNSIIYSPEFRDKAELYNALVQARLHRCFFSRTLEPVTDEEYLSALRFVDDHFIILNKPRRNRDNTQEKMSIRKVFAEARQAKEHYGMDIHFILIDPVNYLEKEGEDKFLETQDYVLSLYDQTAEFSELLGVHTILTAHTRDVELQYDKDTGKQFYGVLHPSTIVGGQSNFRAAYQILHLFRGPVGVVDPATGVPFPENYTRIFTQKSKPFGIGKIGNTSEEPGKADGLFFDTDTYTMYEIVEGVKYYRNGYYRYSEMFEGADSYNLQKTHTDLFKEEQEKGKDKFFSTPVDGTVDGIGNYGF